MAKPKMFKVAKCDLKRTAHVQQKIFVARGQRVMLDADLATLYAVTTKQLNQQLRRNLKRFPPDFAFQLTLEEAREVTSLRSQNVTLKRGQHFRHLPHVFTEHGAVMLAAVLNSPPAIQASIFVVRAFVQMRTAAQEHAELSRRIDALAANCDDQFHEIFDAIRRLMVRPDKPSRPIGFIPTGRKRLKEKK